MYRVGLYGVENSHARAFCKAFRDTYADGFRPTLVGGIYPDSVAALAEEFGAEIENDPEKMAERVDCAMITCRDGKYHLAAALPFIKRGLPLFVDKPLTVSVAECETLVRTAKEYGVRFIGGSSVKISPDTKKAAEFARGHRVTGGSIACPIQMNSEYGGFFFYASHLAETLLEIFGYEPDSVRMDRTDNGASGTVRYPDFDVQFSYVEKVYSYSVQVDAGEESFRTGIDISSIHEKETGMFRRLVIGGESDFSVYQLTKSVYLLDAMYRSMNGGRWEKIGSLPEELR